MTNLLARVSDTSVGKGIRKKRMAVFNVLYRDSKFVPYRKIAYFL
jgi:hypothetical protein